MLKRSLLIICFGLVLPVAGMADQESGTYQYTMESADKKYVFVMLRSCSSDGEVHFYPSNKYPESGLYLNDGSTTPLWTVDWCGYVLLPSDGIHLVRKGRWARTREGNSEEALTFFGDGRLLKSYRISDLVTIPWMLPHSSSHYRWQRLISPEDGDKRLNRHPKAHHQERAEVSFIQSTSCDQPNTYSPHPRARTQTTEDRPGPYSSNHRTLETLLEYEFAAICVSGLECV